MTNNTANELKEILHKISKEVIKLVPYLTILSGMMVWSYLNNIGRLDLLMDSFSINIGLISLLISSIILSFSIAITLILPSSILILHRSIFPSVIRKSISIPWFGWAFSTLFLMLTFLPHVPYIKEIISPLSAIKVSFIITILSLALFVTISLVNDDFNNNSILKKAENFGKVIAGTFAITFAILSISLPITLLLKNGTGEKTTSLLIALVFMIAFAFLSFRPAMVYYNDLEITPSNNEGRSIAPLAKKLAIAVIITITFTSLLFPNVTTTLMNSSLYSIGIIDNKNHHFLINGENYQPEMFPKHIWMTSTTEKIEKSFFIYGVRMFSAGNKNLICPDSVGKLKNAINGTNYDLITSSDSEDNKRKLKDMTDICVVIVSDDAKQWDTFFENDNRKK
jgi:hypothetical protein